MFDGFKQINTDSATLLGAPLSTGVALTACLADRYTDLTRAVERLKFLSAHDALVLPKNSLSAPKLLVPFRRRQFPAQRNRKVCVGPTANAQMASLWFLVRAACCVGHESLRKLGDQMRLAVCNICNVSLTDDQWLQASLPVRNGGLGLRRVSSLASSAFLASAAGTRQLQDQILHRVSQVNDEIFDNCLQTRVDNGTQPPVDSNTHKQRTWDQVIVDAEFNDMLSRYSEPYHEARILAVAASHSGD